MIRVKGDPIERPKKGGAFGESSVSTGETAVDPQDGARARGGVSGDADVSGGEASPERLIFPASKALVQELDREWHRRAYRSRAYTIRVLLQEALAARRAKEMGDQVR